MTTPCRNCLVTVVLGNKLMVVGGETGLSARDKVEIATDSKVSTVAIAMLSYSEMHRFCTQFNKANNIIGIM